MGSTRKNRDRHLNLTALDAAELARLYHTNQHLWQGSGPFVSEPWLRAWWDSFGESYTWLVVRVDKGTEPVAVVPLMVRGDTAAMIGSDDLCDHVDIAVATGYEKDAAEAVLNFLGERELQEFSAHAVRPGSVLLNHLVPTAKAGGATVTVESVGVAAPLVLPRSWDEYLGMLSAKQRHEVRRKFRRLHEAGVVSRRLIDGGAEVDTALALFFMQFRASRTDKQGFMTPAREIFFRRLAHNLATAGMLVLQVVEIDGVPAATTFCMKDGTTLYLYNNGFNVDFKALSIGTMSKVMMIDHAIESRCTVFDFLNGAEPYKFRLGAGPVELAKVLIKWR
jgi:CelD/BcsL family acetyltransferase involved in cellulose biosynthesis